MIEEPEFDEAEEALTGLGGAIDCTKHPWKCVCAKEPRYPAGRLICDCGRTVWAAYIDRQYGRS